MFPTKVVVYKIEIAHTLTAAKSVNLYQELTDTSKCFKWLFCFDLGINALI